MLGLAPLELPPPTGDPAVSRSFARRALLSVVLLAGVPLVAALVIAGMVLANVAAWLAGRVFPFLVITTLVVAVGVGRGLIASIKPPPKPDDELDIPEPAEPELYEMIRALAAQVGTEPPDRIVLVPEVNAYVNEFGPFLGLKRGRRTLAIGAPLLDALDVTELRAVLAHELGHFAGGDTRLGPLAFRTEQSLAHIIEALGDRATALPFIWYFKLQRKVSSSARRDQELVADRASVRIAGRQATADALWAIEIAARGQQLLIFRYLLPLFETGGRPASLADGLRSLLREPARVTELVALDESDGDVDPWASHPPTTTRIERVAAIPDTTTVARDGRAARALLRDPDRWIDAVNEQWLDLIGSRTSHGLVPVAWSAWTERVLEPIEAARSDDVDAALGRLGLPPGLDSLRTAITSGRERELAAGLAARGWRTEGAASREVMLAAAVRTALSHQLCRQGIASWRLSWSGAPDLVLASGATVVVDEPSERAAGGDWTGVDAVLAAAGAASGAASGAAATAHAATAADPATATPAVSTSAPASTVPAAPGAPGGGPGGPSFPDPPMPPFEPASAPWWRQATLPGRHVGQKHVVRLRADAIAIGSTEIAFTDVEHAAVRVKPDGTTGFRVEISITDRAGAEARAVVKTSNEENRARAAMVAAYVWDVLAIAVAPRLADERLEQVRAGATVEMGGLHVSAAGVVDPKRTAAPLTWGQVSHVRSQGGQLAIVAMDGRTLFAREGAEDEVLLSEAVPRLKAFFG